ESVTQTNTVVSAQIDATQGPQTAVLNIVYPEGCAPQTVQFEVPPCEVQPVCPEITLAQSVSDVCDDDGQRQVTVTATATLASGASVSASLKDNDGNVVDTATGAPASLSHTLALAPGSYTFAVEVTAPGGCPGASIVVEVPQCEPETPPPVCPEIHFDPEVSERCNNDGKRGVRVTATVELGTGDPFTVRLVDGDGNELATASSGSDGQATLQHSDTYAPGDYTFTVEVTQPDGCPEASTTVHVPACEPVSSPPPPPPQSPPLPPPPPPTTSTFDLCMLLRVFMLLGAGFAIIGLALLVCPVFAAPALSVSTALIVGGAMTALGAIVFVIALVAWVILCRPRRCNFILLAWQIAAFVMFAFFYIAFCPGCTGWGVVGLVALVAFFALFAWWLFECRPSRCTVFSELLFVMIHIDLIEAIQILLGNCVITSNSIFAGVWVLILGVFTAIAYWGMRRFCPPAPPTTG
ncbi:MAG: hypothetical protein KC547_21405, partial [Anaerolineae bacterium]|nr:hypothetical protein [Anaerolineae bacterium]